MEGISWEKLLDLALRENVEIIKVDCEGYEERLLEVRNKHIIKRVPYWIVEIHSKGKVYSFKELFTSLGFFVSIKRFERVFLLYAQPPF